MPRSSKATAASAPDATSAASKAAPGQAVTEGSIIRDLTNRLGGLADSNAGQVVIGLGDDAAVLRLGPADGARRLNTNDTVITSDLLVEGRHFDLAYMGLDDAAYKALAVSLSDCAAMGARPSFAVGQLGVPAGATQTDIDAVLGGVERALQSSLAGSGVPLSLVGGDTVGAPQWILGFTVLGELRGKALTRTGARPGDQLWTSARLGLAQVGLHVLCDSKASRPKLRRGDYPDAVSAHTRPQAQLELGLWLQQQGLASACLDLSDSLSQSLALLARASGVGIQLDFSRLRAEDELLAFAAACAPVAKRSRGAKAKELAEDVAAPSAAPAGLSLPVSFSPQRQAQSFASLSEFVLASAEDYGLLFSAPMNATSRLLREAPQPLQLLGTVVEASEGLSYSDSTNKSRLFEPQGFKHL